GGGGGPPARLVLHGDAGAAAVAHPERRAGAELELLRGAGNGCETEDKPQPMDEDDLLKPRDPPSNAALSCSDDELEAATQHQQIRQQQLGQSTASRSTASSSGGCTDLVLSGFSMRGR
ncbi:hypothetical protein PF005_g32315, partial [Phytophthora fragariae]